MGFLKNKASGAVAQNLPGDSILYQQIAGLRDVNGQPTWEEISSQDIGAANRIMVIPQNLALGAAVNETVSSQEPDRPGTITAAVYIANSPGIVGAATNSRTLTIVQGSAQGVAVARTTLATLALVAGVNAPTGQPSTAFTINVAAFISDAPLEVVSTAVGAGLADPGGLVLITYTPA